MQFPEFSPAAHRSLTSLFRRLLAPGAANASDVARLTETPRSRQEMLQWLDDGRRVMPVDYGIHYTDYVARNIAALERDAGTLETMAGAVHQHRSANAFRGCNRRLVAVLSDFYRIFYGNAQWHSRWLMRNREARLPPLGVFTQIRGTPFTITLDESNKLASAWAAVVNLPAKEAFDPILWSYLAHETAGHDVAKALPGHVEEMGEFLLNAPSPLLSHLPRPLRALWAHWLNEAVADAYGMMNMGPAFVVAMAAYISAAFMPPSATIFSSQPTVSRITNTLERHPADALRIHLCLGVLKGLHSLTHETRLQYHRHLTDLANMVTESGGRNIYIDLSKLPTQKNGETFAPLIRSVDALAASARSVGEWLVTTRFPTLGGTSYRLIVDWNEQDHRAVLEARDSLLQGFGRQQYTRSMDDAHFLAGATLAALQAPHAYHGRIRPALNRALDRSFEQDDLWRSVAGR